MTEPTPAQRAARRALKIAGRLLNRALDRIPVEAGSTDAELMCRSRGHAALDDLDPIWGRCPRCLHTVHKPSGHTAFAGGLYLKAPLRPSDRDASMRR